MMSGKLMETSFFVLLIRKLGKGYCYIGQRLDEICKNSQTYRIVRKNWETIKSCFRYSFLGKLTEIKDEGNIAVLYESRVVQWVMNLYKKNVNKLTLYLKTSSTGNLAGKLKKEFCLTPVKITSIIVIVAIVTNLIFSVLFKKEIGLLGWLVRGLLLFVGLAGLSPGVRWEDIRKTSFVLNKIILKGRVQ